MKTAAGVKCTNANDETERCTSGSITMDYSCLCYIKWMSVIYT